MTRLHRCMCVAVAVMLVAFGSAPRGEDFVPVSDTMLLKPDPANWLLWGRTYDWHRFSPLKQVTKENVHRLQLVWARGMRPGVNQASPIVYNGVMYLASPNNVIQALNAATGDLMWEYRRGLPNDVGQYDLNWIGDRTRSVALYGDKVYFLSQDAYVVALDARTGKLVWETKTADYRTGVTHASAPIVVKGKLISGRTCGWTARCFIAAHDPETGKELWRFWTAAQPGTPEDKTWAGSEMRGHISPWGAPGGYDPTTGLYYVGTGVPAPYPRIARHNGNPDAIPRGTPAELYSNSTLALDPETGKLAWYFQHLPGDDWDMDHVHERVLIDTIVKPDSKAVDWINPAVSAKPERRKIVVTVGDPGGLWALDRQTGKFLWASAFPEKVPEFILSHVVPETGQAFINWSSVHKEWGTEVPVCYHDAKGWYPMSYSPITNYLYIAWNDTCTSQTAVRQRPEGGVRRRLTRAGYDPNKHGNLTAVDMSTGRHVWRIAQPAGTSGGTLATASNLVFWGDHNRRFRAIDAEGGKVLWETILGDAIANGPITYAVNGRQYIAQLAGSPGPTLRTGLGANAIYVFALPDEKPGRQVRP